MKTCIALCLLSLAFLSTTVSAQAPTDQSLERLMKITRVEELSMLPFETMEQDTTSQIRHVLLQSGVAQENVEQQVDRIEPVISKMVQKARQQMSWQNMNPRYMKLYKDTFTQAEVDGMVEFYLTPAGQAVLEKMPILMQQSIALSQEMMAPLAVDIQRELQAALEGDGTSAVQ